MNNPNPPTTVNTNEFISMDEFHHHHEKTVMLDETNHQEQSIETDRIFCKAKTVYYSIFSVVLFSVLLAFPQLFAYEVKQTQISISPSAMPTSAKALDVIAAYENFFFVENDNYSAASNSSIEYLKEEYLFRILNRTSLSYSDTVGTKIIFINISYI